MKESQVNHPVIKDEGTEDKENKIEYLKHKQIISRVIENKTESWK